VFGALLDRTAGKFRFGPKGVAVPLSRRYEPGTLVIETTWSTETGWVVVRDGLTIADWDERDEDGRSRTVHEPDCSLVRVATCVEGEAEIEVSCLPRFEYGSSPALWSSVGIGEAVADAEDGSRIFLTTDLDLTLGQGSAEGTLHIKEGESAFVSLGWGPGMDSPTRSGPEAVERLDQTVQFWRQWLAQGSFPDHPWRIHLQRSALVLKGLTYAPSGALLAAATTSLPETPGGERNWDYRYSWIRDSTFALWSLHSLGFDDEAKAFLKFVRARAMESDGDLQIMYGIDGEHDLTESTLDHLSGYDGARPVRIGNGAYDQRQNDVWGALMDAIYVNRLTLHRESDSEESRVLVLKLVEEAIEAWPKPDQGIWEARGEPRHYVSSKLMIWVAVDRGARLADQYGNPRVAAGLRETADEIKAEIIEKGCRDGVFRQHYETDALDASVLLMPLVRFLPHDDERIRKTVLAVREGLDDRGMILRYVTEETDDGLHGREGSFLICSFWMVSALSEIGEAEAARRFCERLLGSAGALDLFAEELDAESNRQLGNFPQAFTHLALINAVSHVIADERRDVEPGRATAVFSEMREAGS
jgi:GH15 family glucan-1,4-alpha-glucosidase